MRRFVQFLVIISMLFTAIPAFAQELRAGVTFQSWFTRYERTVGATEISGSSLMFGPTLTMEYDNYYTSASYATTTSDYTFDAGGGESFTGKKKDLELVLGYHLGDNVSLHTGWKHDVLELESSGGPQFSGEVTTSGPALGVTGHVPVGDFGVTVVGDFTVMYLETRTELGSVSEKDNRNGYSMQLGANYRATQRFSASAGYTHQIYVADEGDDTVFSGVYFTFGFGI
ncbi:hypothetical protein LCGC14_2438470 [marine sediment metagenome]|uniref:Uncharacterized protein n=1 Tax=marine sediment metagenome TaxID=412755 RepID=A0A0F9EDN2_9ZZZZ